MRTILFGQEVEKVKITKLIQRHIWELNNEEVNSSRWEPLHKSYRRISN